MPTKITKMASAIITILKRDYDLESLDVKQIVDFCSLYEETNHKSSRRKKHMDESTEEIIFSSPQFEKITRKTPKHNLSIESEEFVKKYSFFTKIIYACLRLDVKIFQETSSGEILKNIHQMVKAIEARKKTLINEHIDILRSHFQNPEEDIGEDYVSYLTSYTKKIKILQDIRNTIKKLYERSILSKNDNMISLLVPYFYTRIKCIERYS
jgi:hypothetical protein